MPENVLQYVDENPVVVEGEVRTLLVVILGSTMQQLTTILYKQLERDRASGAKTVPVRVLVIDTMPYESSIERISRRIGLTPEQVKECLPPAHYCKIGVHFSPSYNFRAPGNNRWAHILYEEDLQSVAKKAAMEGTGAGGTRAVGEAAIQYNRETIRQFLQGHVNSLMDAANLENGVNGTPIPFLIGTHSGGTASGGIAGASVLLSEAVGGSPVHIRYVMPDAARTNDEQTYANAYASVLEINKYAAQGAKGVPMLSDGGVHWTSLPCASLGLYFGRTRQKATQIRDICQSIANSIRTFAYPETQRIALSLLIDLVEDLWDQEGNPFLACQETAISIEPVNLESFKYLAAKYLLCSIEERLSSYSSLVNHYSEANAELKSRVDGAVQTTIETLHISLKDLCKHLDENGTTSIENKRGAAFALIGRTSGKKKLLAEIALQEIDTFKRQNEELKHAVVQRTANLRRELPDRLLKFLEATYGRYDLRVVLGLEALHDKLKAMASESASLATNHGKERSLANTNLSTAITALRTADGRNIVPPWREEEVRDASNLVVQHGATVAKQAYLQAVYESVEASLTRQGETRNGLGEIVPVPSVLEALAQTASDLRVVRRQNLVALVRQATARCESIKNVLKERSPVFCRYLVADERDVGVLDQEALQLMQQQGDLPPIREILAGGSLDEGLGKLTELMPGFDATSKTLESLLEERDVQRRVINLVKTEPLSDINRDVEENQQLRRDRDTVELWSIPGGEQGPIAKTMIREGALDMQRARVVMASTDRILRYFHRGRLPFYALQNLDVYRDKFRLFTKRAAARSPFTWAENRNLPVLLAPKLDRVTHIKHLLLRARINELPEVEQVHLRWKLHFRDTLHNGVTRPATIEQDSFDKLAREVGRQILARQQLKASVELHYRNHPGQHIQALVQRWSSLPADDPERQIIEELCIELGFHPTSPLTALSA